MQIGQSARQILQRAQAAISAHSTPALTDAQAEARTWSLAEFVQAAWPVIEPSTPLVWSWPVQAIADHVQALLDGRLARRNLAILVPPGFAKSTIVSVCAPAWQWIRRPQWRGIFASGNPAVAVRDSLRCRAVVESAWYRQTFGIPWLLADDENLKSRFANTARGFRVALSASARVTGDRSDGLFIDDPLDASDAYSKAARDGVNAWYDMAFANRLNDLRTGTRVLIQQRLHVADLAGHVLAVAGDEWETLVIPQEWDEAFRQTSSVGWTDPRTEPGQLAFPERFPPAVVAAERTRLGASAYGGQHQQRPFDASGEVFKVGALQLWSADDPLPDFQRVILSLDTAFSTRSTADYSVIVVVGEFERGYFLLDCIRARFAYPQLRQIVHETAARWRPQAVLVESAASGQSLTQDLQQSSALPVIPVRPDGDKVVRANVCVPTWEAGRVFALESAPWLPDFLDELYAFPKGTHDDAVDAFTQALRYLNRQPEGFGIMQWYAAKAAEVEAQTAALPAPDAPVADDTPPWHRAGAVSDLGAGLVLPGSAGWLR